MLLLAITSNANAQSAASGVTAEMVQRIESQIVMPRGARPLELYDRHYARKRVGDREVVVGVFLLRTAWRSGARQGATPVEGAPNAYTTMIEDLPVIADGGCSVVTIYFDIMTERLARVRREGDGPETAELGICNGRGSSALELPSFR